MLLSIIIVSYNTELLTKRAVESVLRDIERSAVLADQTEIIVVDNASSDASVVMLKKMKRQTSIPFRILANTTNDGFAGANNKAIQRSTGAYVLLLNPDTYVQAGCLEKLVATFERLLPDSDTAYSADKHDPFDRLGIVAATLLNPDGTIQAQGGDLPTLLSVAAQYLLIDDIPILGRVFPTTQHGPNRSQPPVNYTASSELELLPKGWVGGTAMLIRRAVFDEIGYLDEYIFMYGEDIEFCQRAADHHWDVCQHPSARVTHLQSASAGTPAAILGEAKGYVYIWAKHKPAWQKPFLTAILRTGALLRMVLFTILSAPRQKIAPYESIWEKANLW